MKINFTIVFILLVSICFAQKQIEDKPSKFVSYQKVIDSVALEKGISEKELSSLLKYNTRYKMEKGTGKVFAYTFGSFATLGLLIEISTRIHSEEQRTGFFNKGDGLFFSTISGIIGGAISIPLFKAAKRNKNKRDEIAQKHDISKSTIRQIKNKRRFRLYSISYDIGISNTDYPIDDSMKLMQADLGVSFVLDNNIFSVYLGRTNGSSDAQNSEYTFNSFDLTFGRSFNFGDKFNLEVHTGISKVEHNYRFDYLNPESSKGGFGFFNFSDGNNSIYESIVKKSYGIPL